MQARGWRARRAWRARAIPLGLLHSALAAGVALITNCLALVAIGATGPRLRLRLRLAYAGPTRERWMNARRLVRKARHGR